MIRYALPIRSFEGTLSEMYDHFSKSEYFAIIDAEGDRITSINVIHNEPAMQNQKKAADILADSGVNIVLTGVIGPCMISIFKNKGVRIFMGAEGTITDAFEDYLAGKLKEVDMSRYL